LSLNIPALVCPSLVRLCDFSICDFRTEDSIICSGAGAPGQDQQSSTSGEKNMSPNKNQVKGVVKDAVGKVQEKAGKLVGNKEQQVKGLQKQVEGKAEKQLGDVKEVIKDAVNKS
jgi:uncharacterized protein YjbJ (UPF0337 family)